MAGIGKVFFPLLLSVAVEAEAGVNVAAMVENNQIAVNQILTLTVAVSSDQSINVNDPKLPQMPGFQLVRQSQGRESRSVFNNGKFQFLQTQKYFYDLLPQAIGVHVIPAIDVVVDGTAYKTSPIKITVLNGAQGRGAPPSHQAQAEGEDEEVDPFFQDADEVFNQLLQRRGLPQMQGRGKAQPVQPGKPDEAFAIQVEVDKRDVYAGEQVTANFYLVTRNDIRDIDTLKYPTLQGFWKEDIEIATRLNFQQEIINGVPYRKALLASYALFPIKEGTVIVDSYKAKCTVLISQGNYFGFGQPYQFTKVSPEIKIQVKPIPSAGRPKEYSSGVGEFSLRTWVDTKTVPAHQPFSFHVRFEGRGNAKNIDLPPLKLPEGMELYDTKSETKFSPNGTSYKDFELLLIPRIEGQMILPEIAFSFFDPRKRAFEARRAAAIEMNVLPGRPGGAPPSAGEPGNAMVSAPETTPYVPLLEIQMTPKAPWSDDFRLFFWTSSFVAALGLLFWRYRTVIGKGRKRKSLANAVRKRFRKIRDLLDGGNARAMAGGCTSAVYAVLGELAQDASAAEGFEMLFSKLAPSLRREIEKPLRDLMRDFEAISFAPDHMVGELKEKSVQKNRVAELEKTLLRAIQLSEQQVPEEKVK